MTDEYDDDESPEQPIDDARFRSLEPLFAMLSNIGAAIDRGEITAVAVVATKTDGGVASGFARVEDEAAAPNFYTLLGALDVLRKRMLDFACGTEPPREIDSQLVIRPQ